MSKQNNRNPGQYDATRNHPGEGILQEENKQDFDKEKAREKEGEKNFIPGEAPVGEKSRK